MGWVPNFIVWKPIIEKWLEFASDAQSIRLRLALDGVNPFGNLSFVHST